LNLSIQNLTSELVLGIFYKQMGFPIHRKIHQRTCRRSPRQCIDHNVFLPLDILYVEIKGLYLPLDIQFVDARKAKE
jgi:hypothetical protein